ncbi:MAG: polyphosphate kinase 1 [Desulfobacterales bacterium]|nr:polyphosphate kinase 1 [Desulfobacterales bacterium]MDX2510792.1 polyphosphate kinase 1 [Desulfobacterales bacterium]
MKVKDNTSKTIEIDSPETYINRELSWLSFARRVLAMAQDHRLPLLERVKFAGIMGMLYDEFAMKRIGGLKRKIQKGKKKPSRDGLTPDEQLKACRAELDTQTELVSKLVQKKIRPALSKVGIPILEYKTLNKSQRGQMLAYFKESVEPILTPLAVDVSHPFPFISNLGLNLAINVTERKKKHNRFVRIKVPANRPRWVPLLGKAGFVPLEQVIAANLQQLFPQAVKIACYFFRVTRVAKDDPWEQTGLDNPAFDSTPGIIVSMVTNELKARKFAGVVRLEVGANMPKALRSWLVEQLGADLDDVESVRGLLALADLSMFSVKNHPELRYPSHTPVTHPRLSGIDTSDPDQIFAEIRRAEIMLHHPYHSFDSSVLNFLQCASVDPKVLAIKLTIYRTSSDSPIVQALQRATRNGKQVSVLVEITARFDEAPNIAWGQLLEQVGVHVAYGVERLKTHVKLALVVREEENGLRRYVHVGTGNYHTGTARIYEDLGVLSCDPELGANVAALFNELTSATPYQCYNKLMVAPHNLRERITRLIHREAENKRKGKPCGIKVKMNQLQDAQIIKELYHTGQAGVPISLNIRGLCCLRAGVPGLSENIRVFCTLGRFLEHSRIYRFENAGDPEYFIGSADWMRRNLDRRMESVMPVTDPILKIELEKTLQIYEDDNSSAWDMQPDGNYRKRKPKKGGKPRSAQETFIDMTERQSKII